MKTSRNPPKARMLKAREAAAHKAAPLGALEHGYIDAGDLAGKTEMGPKHRANLFYPHDASKRTQYVDGWMMGAKDERQNPAPRKPKKVLRRQEFEARTFGNNWRKLTDQEYRDYVAGYLVPTHVRKIKKKSRSRRSLKIRKHNPSWFIHIQGHPRGPVMLWNGKSFNDQEDSRPLPFSSPESAMQKARWLRGKFYKALKNYKIWVSDQIFGSMLESRRVNSTRRKNPESIDEAAQKLEDFTGRPATHVERVESRSPQKTAWTLGELDLIGYRAAREGISGGKMVRYSHPFRKGSRPLLATSTDGKQLKIVGGRYEVTEAGIEDR